MNYNTSIGEYSGITSSQLDDLALLVIEAVPELAEQLIRSADNFNELMDSLWELVENLFLYTFLLGIGGINNISSEALAWLNEFLAEQRSLFSSFVNLLYARGESSEGFILNRIKLYLGKAWGTYQQGRLFAKTLAGFTQMKRHLRSNEPCYDCPPMAGFWADIGTLPLPTFHCECGGNCKCIVEWR